MTTTTNGAPMQVAAGWWQQPPDPPTLGARQPRPLLPPAGAVRPYNAELADLIDQAARAEREAATAAQDWQAANTYRAAITDDRAYTLNYLERFGEVPDVSRGPLSVARRQVDHAYTRAWRAEVAVEWHRERLDEAAPKAMPALEERYDELTERIRTMCEQLGERDTRGWSEVEDVAWEASELFAVIRWAAAPASRAPGAGWRPPLRSPVVAVPMPAAVVDIAEAARERATGITATPHGEGGWVTGGGDGVDRLWGDTPSATGGRMRA